MAPTRQRRYNQKASSPGRRSTDEELPLMCQQPSMIRVDGPGMIFLGEANKPFGAKPKATKRKPRKLNPPQSRAQSDSNEHSHPRKRGATHLAQAQKKGGVAQHTKSKPHRVTPPPLKGKARQSHNYQFRQTQNAPPRRHPPNPEGANTSIELPQAGTGHKGRLVN